MRTSNQDRRFMKIAIAEMNGSRSEHLDRFDPLVGAVLVDKDGAELDRAHRGRLREGDHAEYTLLERLLPDRNLDGSTLYVTLEPCTTRQPPKAPCAERIVAARIKRVFIGMPDPNPRIQGRGITYLLERGVVVNFFDIDLVQKVFEANSEFIEQYDQASEADVEPQDEFEGPSDKEKERVPSATLEDLSEEAIQAYLDARSLSFDITSPDLRSFLHKNGFLASPDSEGELVPTVAGVLLFGKAPEDFLVQCKVKAEARRGDRTVSADIVGPLLSLPERVERFFTENMGTFTRIEGFRRIELPEYPVEALREAVVNAIAHRDYGEGARVLIQILDDRIVIRSPGHLLRPLTLERIRSYEALPYTRNPRIAETFFNMRLMEERGWGIRAMRDILSNYGLPPPRFDYDDSYFVVTLYGPAPTARIQISAAISAQLNTRQKKLLDFLIDQGRMTNADSVEKFDVSRQTAISDFKRLIELGVIEKRGAGRGVHYVLIGS